jgi:holin-like protein
MDLLAGTAVIAACWGAGEAAAWLAEVPFPGSLAGMALLAVGVRRGWFAERWVRRPAAWLLGWMPLFFVPAGVSLLDDRTAAGAWLAIVLASAASTVAVTASAGWLHQRLATRG